MPFSTSPATLILFNTFANSNGRRSLGSQTAFRQICKPIPECAVKCDDDGMDEFCDKLNALASELLWLPVVPYEVHQSAMLAPDDHHREAYERFRAEFHTELKRMPYIQTIVSRPMPPDRVLHCCEYLFRVELFQTHEPNCPPRNVPSMSQTSNGLLDLIFPAMDSQVLPFVTRLFWQDKFSRGSYIHRAFPEAFQQFESLSMDLTAQNEQNYENMIANLDAATNVKHLRLRIQCAEFVRGFPDLERALLRDSSDEKRTRWSSLHSLSLTSPRLVRKRLFNLVESNADVLRHLCLRNCHVKLSTAKKLAKIPRIHLKSLVIVEDERRSGQVVVSEHDLLHFINKTSEGMYHSACSTLENIPRCLTGGIVVTSEETSPKWT